MAKETRGDSLAKLGPVAGPVLGVVLAVAFIATAVLTNPISEQESELRASIQRIDQKLESSERTDVEDYDAPLVDSVRESLTVRDADYGRPPATVDRMTNLPIEWFIHVQGPEVDEFTEFDSGNKGYWTEEDFRRTPYFRDSEPDDPRGSFSEWDTDDDGQISRAEYNDPPVDDDIRWDELNKDGNKVLDVDEIGPEQLRKWDRYPYDDEIDRDEFGRRNEPQASRNFGPAANVRTYFDPRTMQFVTSWEAPALENLPEDMSYLIWRHAPETIEDRRRAWRETMGEHVAEERAWETEHFNPWRRNVSEAYAEEHSLMTTTGFRRHFASLEAETWYESVNTNEYRRHVGLPEIPEDVDEAARAQIESESRDRLDEVFRAIQTAEPVPPPEPDEWELVTDAPITGTEYRDSNVEFGVTYTYAVQMGSEAHPPTRVVADETEIFETLEGISEYFVFEHRTPASTPPVRAQNRVSIAYRGGATAASTLALTTWYRHDDEGSVTWYRMRVTGQFEADDDIGAEYSFAQLEERDAVLIDVSGAETAIGNVLGSDIGSVDFSTGFRYEGRAGGEVIMSSRDMGDGVIPTRDDSAPEAPSPIGMENPVEVRALAVRSGGQSAMFELTRWHLAGDGEWLRVVMRREVESGADVGTRAGLSGDVQVFDATGNELTGADLQAYGDEEVDFTVGNFGGLEGRTVIVGDQRFDLFDTLYVEGQD